MTYFSYLSPSDGFIGVNGAQINAYMLADLGNSQNWTCSHSFWFSTLLCIMPSIIGRFV